MNKEANPNVATALAQHQQGQWQEAKKSYQAILATDANNLDVLHLLGIVCGQLGEWALAKDTLEQVITLSPDNATYYNSLGNVKKNLGDREGAIADYQRSTELNPEASTAYNNLAFLLIKENQLEPAQQAAEKAARINPQDAESHYNFALIALKQNHPTQAISALRETLRLNPQHLQAHYTLAQQLQAQAQNHEALDEAIEHYQVVLKAQPEFADALVNYASALLIQQKDQEALKLFYKALESDPEHYEANYNLGCALFERNELKLALEHFIKALAKKPTAEGYYNAGVIYSYQDRHGDALSYLKKAIETDPHYFAAFNNLGTVYLKLQDIPNAIISFEAALKLQPQNEEIAYILSALKQEKTPEQAPQAYVEHLFDQYAPSFDKHLLEHLKYTTPECLYEAVMAEIRDNQHCRKVLDLGCGTGLAGALFKEIAFPLIGVDLSAQMIAMLEKKDLYDELIVGELLTVLKQQSDNELIIASDVLPYLGDLAPLFKAVQLALTPEGLFAFTTEIAPPAITTYALQTSIRYAHATTYIEQLAADNNFTVLSKSKITLRLQHNQPLEGMLFVLKIKS